MPHEQVLFRWEARNKILRGARVLADAIHITLGHPGGSEPTGSNSRFRYAGTRNNESYL
jgi:hypothetical protein